MKTKSLPFVLQALTAAIFFGASAPFAKLLLGDISPVYLAAFLYLGSGTGVSLIKLGQRIAKPTQQVEAGIKKADFKWLAGAIISGGVMAPIVLMVSLQNTPASTASLLLNLEGVGTTLIALLFFKEAISRRAWMAILVITLVGSALIYATFDMPAYGDAASPANSYMGEVYVDRTAKEIAVLNIVTAVLASYRGFDTLGETMVIFTAGLGVILLLGAGSARGGKAVKDTPDKDTTWEGK